MSELVVEQLSRSLKDDFLLFFDHVAFVDNPDWSDCYCSVYHLANTKGKVESRRQASSLIEEDRTLVVGLLSCFSQGTRPLSWSRCLSSKRVLE